MEINVGERKRETKMEKKRGRCETKRENLRFFFILKKAKK